MCSAMDSNIFLNIIIVLIKVIKVTRVKYFSKHVNEPTHLNAKQNYVFYVKLYRIYLGNDISVSFIISNKHTKGRVQGFL